MNRFITDGKRLVREFEDQNQIFKVGSKTYPSITTALNAAKRTGKRLIITTKTNGK